jgi:hypothetical protein
VTGRGKKRNSIVAGRGWAGLARQHPRTQMSSQDKTVTVANLVDAEPPADSDAAEGTKVGRASAGSKPPRKAISKKTEGGAPRVVKKRGPPRPHRRLAQEVLMARIGKLQKRINKARGLLEEAERHIEAYSHEEKYRAAEAREAQYLPQEK